MLSSFELISHPDRTLKEHLSSCNQISERILDFKFVSDKFFSKEFLQLLRKRLIYFHDFGKATDFFQDKIIEATLEKNISGFVNLHTEYIEDFKKGKQTKAQQLLRLNDRLSNHSKMGAYFQFIDFQSNDIIVDLILLKVIRRHHGELTNFILSKDSRVQVYLEAKDVEEIETQIAFFNEPLYKNILDEVGISADLSKWRKVKNRFTDILDVEDWANTVYKSKDFRYFFLQHFLFSLLLSADKGDMMLEMDSDKEMLIKPKKLLPKNIIADFKSIYLRGSIQKSIDILREQAYEDIARNTLLHGNQSFFSITLPTGLGKTFSAYNAAVVLQNVYFEQTSTVPRIIYCLPFTSIIDQNAQILEDIFKSTDGVDTTWITKHHYLSTFNEKEKYDDYELRNDEGEYLTAGWEQEVVVTTFVQFLESIFTNKNRSLRKFHNMTNAIFILDEVQNIPPKYYEAIEMAFRNMAEYFNTKFIFVTATQPFLCAKRESVIELSDPSLKKTAYYFNSLDRILLDQSHLKSNDYQSKDISQWIEIFIEDVEYNPEKSFLFICNTIAQSQAIFQSLQAIFSSKGYDFIYLSGSILPIFRKSLVARIKQNTDEKRKQIIVATQVVEAGVDIDLDVVWRDFAPLDSINQSAGRCNRNGINGKGTVKLFNAGKASKIYDAVLLDITRTVLEKRGNQVQEREIYELNLDFAQSVRNSITNESNESKLLIDAMLQLQLESVADNFKLIDEVQYAYNVFIPFDKTAEKVWKDYITLFKKFEGFDLKREIKKIKPKVLQYVTHFPKNKYSVSPDNVKKSIIYEPYWNDYYDLATGFKQSDLSVVLI